MVPDLFDVVRGLNVALALYVLVQCLRPRAIRWWRTRPPELRFLLLGLLALMVAASWGTVETLLLGLPGGSRVLILTVALAWTATGTTLLHRRLSKETP